MINVAQMKLRNTYLQNSRVGSNLGVRDLC